VSPKEENALIVRRKPNLMSHLNGGGTTAARDGLARWRSHAIALAAALTVFTIALVALAHVMDDFGPPPAGDPSAHTGPLIGEKEAIDDLELLDPANEGALEGGDPFVNNGRGPAPGRGLGPPALGRVLPPGLLQDRPGRRPPNGGFRDGRQRHGYSQGEFGPGGLYHRVYTADNPGAPTLVGTTAGMAIRFHPNMPVQDPTPSGPSTGRCRPSCSWRATARRPDAPLQRAADRHHGQQRLRNAHHHHPRAQRPLPGESDGFAGAFFFPGQFYDYRWPLQLAGYSNTTTPARSTTTPPDPKAATALRGGRNAAGLRQRRPGDPDLRRTGGSRSPATGARR
jgi:hypothetical protein